MQRAKKYFEKLAWLFFLLLLVANFSSSYGQTWRLQKSFPDVGLRDVCFVDSLHGWVVGSKGTILQTRNGGESWQLQNSGSDRSLRRVTFVDTLHGWVVESGGGIISTSDGGRTWQPQNTIENFASISVYFLNREYGWAVGGLDILLETRDGGATWEKRYERDPGVFLGVFFLDENIGWIVGAAVSIIEDNFDDGLILHTEDGGQTWQEQLKPVGYSQRVLFRDPNNGWAVGAHGILKTNDGGQHWMFVNAQPGPFYTWYEVSDIAWPDSHLVWASFGPFISHSNDGRNTWTYQLQDSTRRFEALSFPDSKHGWAAGRDHRTGRDGAIWRYEPLITAISEPHSEGPQVRRYALHQNYPNPFNPTTKIRYELPTDGFVTLEVFDVLGRKVRVLFQGRQSAGNHSLDFDASRFSAGIYFFRLMTGGFSATRKMMFLP